MIRYGKWTIRYDPPPIPFRGCDWRFVHDDFDGAPIHSESDDCPDRRCGHGASDAECKLLIDEMEDDR
jgi:hypothetical protein